jgi:exopolysaccharide biosynthesis polyprenyl glycosylphosphotransferase
MRPRRILMFADPLSAIAAFLGAYGVLRLRGVGLSDVAISTGIMALFTTIISLGLMARAGQYADRRRFFILTDIGTLARDLVIGIAVATFLEYLTKGFFMGNAGSRLATGAFLSTFFVLGAVARLGLRTYEQRLFAHGRAIRKILIVGTGAAAADFMQFISKRPWLGVSVAGMVRCNGHRPVPDEASIGEEALYSPAAAGAPVIDFSHSIEGLRHLDALLRSSGASEVVVALDPEDQGRLPQVAELLSLAHVPFKVVPSLFEQTYRTTELLGFAELPVVDVGVDPLDRVARTFKRVLDVFVASAALVLLSPLVLVVVVAVAAESGFPIFYKSPRIGKNGRPFFMYKFRTMVKDADARFDEVEAQNELAGTEGRMFKMHRDPRITRVGTILRKFSVDELPQIINVLKHDMSVVGPRPPLPREVEKYEREHLYRLRAMPGITGMWQVSGRSDLDFEDMVRLDRYYLDNWSIKLDLNIIIKTVFVVLGRKGAY